MIIAHVKMLFHKKYRIKGIRVTEGFLSIRIQQHLGYITIFRSSIPFVSDAER